MIDQFTKNELVQNARLFLQYTEKLPIKVSCLDCCHWDHRGDSCKLCKAKPPATVIVNTCEKFDLDIPF